MFGSEADVDAVTGQMFFSKHNEERRGSFLFGTRDDRAIHDTDGERFTILQSKGWSRQSIIALNGLVNKRFPDGVVSQIGSNKAVYVIEDKTFWAHNLKEMVETRDERNHFKYFVGRSLCYCSIQVRV